MEQTMTDEKLEKLLQHSESFVCDFKWENYHMDQEESRISFLKDILSMANTIREGSAFIITGVRQHDGISELQNVDTSVDENYFLTFIKGTIGPEYPEFTYYTHKYKRFTLGVFEIGISSYGPFYSKKDFGEKIIKQVVYYRYGSSNTMASDRMIEEITSWMRRTPNDRYSSILEQVEYYNTDKYNYVLFLGEDAELSDDQYKLLGKIKWSVIIDMTRGSETQGFYKKIQPILDKHISIHLITTNNFRISNFYDGKTLLWFMAGGEREIDGNTLDVRQWRSTYLNKINEILSFVGSVGKKGIIYLSLFSGKKSECIENIVGMQESNILFRKYITIDWSKNFDITEECGYVNIHGLLNDIFMTFQNTPSMTQMEETYRLPNSRGENRDINNVSWIQEELEPLYENIDNIVFYDIKDNIGFLEGGILSWEEMNPCKAVEREKYKELISQIQRGFEKDELSCKVIPLDYMAGAGATTVLRMVGWFFHEKYPVVFIRKYSGGNTVERINSINHDVDKSKMLLIVDEVTIDAQIVQELKNKLLIEGIHAIILFSKRYLFNDTENYLKEQLLSGENKAFYKLYFSQIDTLEIPNEEKVKRKYALSNVKDGDLAQRTPFMYALTTYEKDFVRISEYVANHLKDMNDEQENIFKVISVIQHFTGDDVPLFILEDELTVKTGRLAARNRLKPLQRALLIFGTNDLRVIHHCVAEEILKYICGRGLLNKEAWRNNLESVFDYVISVLKKFKYNSLINEIITLLFLKKADDDTKHFSYAIEELWDPLAKKRILMKLKDEFGENAYVYSNLARFYHYVEENEELALDEINQAIHIHEDYTFYHFKGVILAKEIGRYIEKNGANIRNNYSNFVEKIIEYRDNVISAYDKSIEMKYDNSYAYGAKVNFYLDIVRKFQKNVFPEKNKEEFFESERYYWCTRFMAELDETLKDISVISEYTDLEMDIENYQNQVLEIQGDMSKAIHGWDSMLTKKDVYYPIIRKKLVSGYYELYKHDWNALPKEKVNYVHKILQDNILEESDNYKNILQWFEFSRYFKGNLSQAVEYFSKEVDNANLQYYFYGMIVFVVAGISNEDVLCIQKAKEYIKKCENYARNYPYRTSVREFYNPKKEDICAIEKYLDLKVGQEKLDDILKRIDSIEGRIYSIDKPEIGWIKIKGTDLYIKFNPSWNQERIYRKDKDVNCPVKFVLGFRYEGPYAYNVQDIE